MVYKYVAERNKKNISVILRLNILCCIYICAWILLPVFKNATDSGILRLVFFSVAGTWFFTTLMIKSNWLASLIPSLLIGLIYPLFKIIYYITEYGNIQANGLISPFFIILCKLI